MVSVAAEQLLAHSEVSVSTQDIEVEQEEEVDTFTAGLNLDTRQAEDQDYLRPLPESSKRQKLDPEKLSQHLKKASENVVVADTLKEYTRLWKDFLHFCAGAGFLAEGQVATDLYPETPADVPKWIGLWIMNKCDDIDVWTGKPKPPTVIRAKYGTAQKMRAAISHKFGRDYGLGMQPWTEDPLAPGKYKGNPSISVAVSQYMVSLRRRKVRAGEVVTSARAINEGIMKQLYYYNIAFATAPIGPLSKKRKAEHPEYWAGYVIRMMLELAYIIAKLCLLRFDELLRIRWSHVRFERLEDGVQFRIRLALPFRKTHQNGGISPFYLYPSLERPWLCAVRAFTVWWQICRGAQAQMGGLVFRKKIGRDQFSEQAEDGMSVDSFMECFRNNLCDIRIDPRPYGTHSFRRGGCQYLAMTLRWPLRDICSWGGWAEDFDNPGTIFKYLLSWNDTPNPEREDYFNPRRIAADPCTSCGRTCHCA